MDHIGIDVHKRESQIYILAESGEVIERRIRTKPERFAAVLGTRPHARILIEASSDSEWVARCLEALGHEVIVVDSNFAPMYATRSRKVKDRPARCPGLGRGALPACVATPISPGRSFGIHDCTSEMRITLFNETHYCTHGFEARPTTSSCRILSTVTR